MTIMPSIIPSSALVHLPLGERSYDIVIDTKIIDHLETFLAPILGPSRLFVVTEETVEGLYGGKVKSALSRGGIPNFWFTLKSGEGSKSFACFEGLLDQMLDKGIERGDTVLALGGGVIGDLAGFAAATILRGVDFIQVPTTLLSQVDSSVGGKTGINSRFGKNLVGAFYQPRTVLIDPSVLATLPQRELQAGYAEVLKYGLIDDPDFFTWLEANGKGLLEAGSGDQKQLEALVYAIKTSCEAKARIVAEDERESGKRALLNFGHTFGHALEAECGYDGTLLHGEGVAIGMVMALALSARMGSAAKAEQDRLINHLKSVGMKWSASQVGKPLDADNLLRHMVKDKKSKAGQVGFILGGIGKAKMVYGVDLDSVKSVLNESISAESE